MRSTMRHVSLLLALLLVIPAGAQSRTEREKAAAQSQLTSAETALAAAEAAGAATLSRELYNEAADRLRQARANWNNNDRRTRENAGRRAVEARAAAMAAEAHAMLLNTNTEIRNLQTDIGNFGGTSSIDLYTPPSMMINRGATSMDRVIVAESALRAARAAGAERFAANELERIQANLRTARTVAKTDKQSESADHLAYVAEMEARRLELLARRNAVSPRLPELRAERTRLAQVAIDTRARDEEQRRLAAEQQAAELRRQLETQSANRQAEQAELERLRQQVASNDAAFRARLDQDRAARIAAEQALDDLMQRYQAALMQGTSTSVQVDELRRQVEDQRMALQSIQNRERQSETSMSNQIATLEQALERERSEGRSTAEALASREQELTNQRNELARLQREREEAERLRAEADRTRAAAITEAEQRRATAEAEAQQLRQQVAQTSAALETAQTELARRDAQHQQRIETMQQSLSQLAQTRQSERGFIVTLPGLFFDTGKAVLKPGARNTLSKIADQLRVNDEIRISVEGHTDAVGSEELNQRLSEKRAAAVRDYLVNRGVSADRITTVGLGESAPIATNDDASGRQQNRRVELVISQ